MAEIRGCGKPEPELLYEEANRLVEEITTTSDEHCGDPFLSRPSYRTRSLLCKDCAVHQGVIYGPDAPLRGHHPTQLPKSEA
jgi:hypothetical protein